MKAAIKKWVDKEYADHPGRGGKETNLEQEFLLNMIGRCMADIRPKSIQLLNIEPDEIINGSTYIWDVGSNKLLVSATLDCLIAFHDDSVWPYRDRLLGSLYGPIDTAQ